MNELLEKLKNAPLHVQSSGTKRFFNNNALVHVFTLHEAIRTIEEQQKEIEAYKEALQGEGIDPVQVLREYRDYN